MIFLLILSQIRWANDPFLAIEGVCAVFDRLDSICLTFSLFLPRNCWTNFEEIQKLAYGALQNQVQERITSDDKRIENELIARRDIMKIKFNLKIENMMFAIAMQSELPKMSEMGNEKFETILELWNLQQQSHGKWSVDYDS